MFDYEKARQSTLAYWNNQPQDIPFYINGFAGTFAYSDHSLIPQSIQSFLLEYFWDQLAETRRNHITSISLDKINSCLNELWEGPGSMQKLVNIMYDIRKSRQSGENNSKDVLKGYHTPTLDSNLVVDTSED